MRNSNLKTGTPGRGMALHPAVVAAREGYTQARAGKPLNPDLFDTPISQSNYEIGRLWALNIMTAKLTPPAWPSGRNAPANVMKTLGKSVTMTGGCQPGKWDGR